MQSLIRGSIFITLTDSKELMMIKHLRPFKRILLACLVWMLIAGMQSSFAQVSESKDQYRQISLEGITIR